MSHKKVIVIGILSDGSWRAAGSDLSQRVKGGLCLSLQPLRWERKHLIGTVTMETTRPQVRGQIGNHVVGTHKDHLIPWNEKFRLILSMMQQGLDSARFDNKLTC